MKTFQISATIQAYTYDELSKEYRELVSDEKQSRTLIKQISKDQKKYRKE